MKLIIPTYDPSVEPGFGPDIFNRQPYAKSLTTLVRKSNDPLVISINGSWGEGKTTFVKSWQKMLDENYVPNIYIDAFASDYVDDAFMVVAGAITDYMQEKLPDKKTEAFLDKAKHVGAQLLSIGAKVSIRAITGGIANLDDFKGSENAIEGIGDDLSEGAEKYIKHRLANHKNDLASVEQFKEYLSTIPALLESETNHSLTIIIDELDRCRPSFAVEMLEKIKHLFSVRNITFVLVVNKEQLKESIRASYGNNIDAHTYLQKFLTIETELPRIGHREEPNLGAYCKYLQQAHEIEISDLSTIMEALGNFFQLTLRQMERVYSQFVLTSMSGSLSEDFVGLYSALAALKVAKPDLFKRLSNNSITYSELFQEIGYDDGDDSGYNYALQYSLRSIKTLKMSDTEWESLDAQSYHRILLRRTTQNRPEILRRVIARINTLYLN